MLTKKQHELLLFIDERLRESGISPSFDEMKEALGLRSKSGIHRLITALEERGFIRRLAHRARALEVLRLPDSAQATIRAGAESEAQNKAQNEAGTATGAPMTSAGNVAGNIIEPDFSARRGPLSGAVSDGDDASVALPLYGQIAAGTPIEALANHDRSVGYPAAMMRAGHEHYALEVAGDSMIEAGIYDGDTVIIERSDMAENGEIIVALIDEEEATLKRMRRKGNSIALEAANPAYETRIFGPDRVKVQGRLIGLMRAY